MSDSSAAWFCGRIFDLLAKHPEENKELAGQIYDLIWESDLDVDVGEMESDEECVSLGLAKKEKDPDFPADTDVVIWRGRAFRKLVAVSEVIKRTKEVLDWSKFCGAQRKEKGKEDAKTKDRG